MNAFTVWRGGDTGRGPMPAAGGFGDQNPALMDLFFALDVTSREMDEAERRGKGG